MPRKFIPPLGGSAPVGYDFVYKYTSGVFHAYADSSMPDDTGDGLSWLTAKKTLAAAVAVLPEEAEDHVVLHLKGSFVLTDTVLVGIRIAGNGKRLLIDGGDEIIVVDGPYTATSSSTTSLTDSARSWTPNTLRGYTVEILDGAAAGYQYTIQSNTVDTIVVGKTWPAPGTPQYRVVKPATVLSSTGFKYIQVTGKVDYRVTFQRMRMDGTMYIGLSVAANSQYCELGNIIFEPTASGNIFASGPTGLILHYSLVDPSNPSVNMHTSGQRMGVSYLGSNAYSVSIGSSISFSCYGLSVFTKPITIQDVAVSRISNGVWLSGIEVLQSILELGYSATYGTSGVLENVSASGILAKDSRVTVSTGFFIQNCASHGIQLDNSTLECQSAVLSGSGNAGAGVYLKNRSSVIFKEGYTPTLTGTAGDIAVTSETVADATWAQVAAGDPVEIMPDGSVKEVP